MTCPYFSRIDNKIRCRVYGQLDASKAKEEECHSHYAICLNNASRELNDSTKRRLVVEQLLSEDRRESLAEVSSPRCHDLAEMRSPSCHEAL